MVKKYFHLLFLCSLFLLGSCASGGRGARKKFRANFVSGKYEDSLKDLKDSSVIDDKKSRALLYMEEARALHQLGRYQASNRLLYLAKSIREKSYTKISQKFGSFLGNDYGEDYLGSLYEFSHLYFYLTLNHFLLSQRGTQLAYEFPEHEKNIKSIVEKKLSDKQVREELYRSRASLLAWDSMLKSQRDDRLGKSVFKYDMLAKVFGGFVHEAIGTRSDQNIALKLYEKGLEILLKNYNGYPTFNFKFKKFNKNYKKLASMALSQVKQKFVKESNYQKGLKNLLHYKILNLTRILNKGSYPSKLKKLKPAKQVRKLLKRAKGKQVCLVLQDSVIAELKAKKYDIGLKGVLKNAPRGSVQSLIAEVGLRVLMNFAVNELGLVSHRRSGPGNLFGVGIAALAAYQAGISFELPSMDRRENTDYHVLYISQSGRKVASVPLAIVNPISDLALEMVEKQSVSNFIKIGSRVALKHAAAIATAYITYKAINKKSKNGMSFFAKSAATLQYLALSRGIEASEKADIRYWSSLPNSIQMGFVNLKPGTYDLEIKKLQNSTVVDTIELDSLVVAKDKNNYLLNVSSK